MFSSCYVVPDDKEAMIHSLYLMLFSSCCVVPASTAVASGVHGLWCEAMLLSESNLLVPFSISCAWHSELAPPSLIINDGVFFINLGAKVYRLREQ